jgi:DNA/RNA-binding domain of Phe-tRNA-synthetase-like protein
MQITVHNRIPRPDVALGLVAASGLEVLPACGELATALDACIAARRSASSSESEERLRQGCRDMLRNGSYKPTGRGKPASEYLSRAALEGTFPRLNGPVDANNLVSLAFGVPISVWDVALAGAAEFEFRLGLPAEKYEFNAGGQVIELGDLLCGCALSQGGSRPIVTPIKDSLATKLQPQSNTVCGAIYYPLAAGSRGQLERATADFCRWLGTCGARAAASWTIAAPHESAILHAGV